MSRTQARRNTKTKAMRMSKKGKAVKSREARTRKLDGRFQKVELS